MIYLFVIIFICVIRAKEQDLIHFDILGPGEQPASYDEYYEKIASFSPEMKLKYTQCVLKMFSNGLVPKGVMVFYNEKLDECAYEHQINNYFDKKCQNAVKNIGNYIYFCDKRI